MIIDSPLTFGLTVGAERRIPQEDDARVHVPATIVPVALMAQVHTIVAPPLPTQLLQSFIEERTFIRTNLAQLVVNVAVLSPGLWELELTMAALFNFNTAFANNSIRLSYKGTNPNLLKRYAFIGSATDFNRLRLLLDAPATLSVLVGATNEVATNTTDCAFLINAIKII